MPPRRRFPTLKAYREAYALTQKAAAARVSITQGAWNRIERGLEQPRPPLAHRLVALTGVPLDELVLRAYRPDVSDPPAVAAADDRPALRGKRVPR
jgi:transcriptional regulator with XRE-family HTH domain